MPTYAALIYAAESGAPAPDSPEMEQIYQAYRAFTDEARKAGILKGGDGLLPTTTATTVRMHDGKTTSTQGPFAQTEEQLSGFFIVECKDLDDAITWAARIPDAARGSIELRPVLESERAREAWAIIERMIEGTKRQRAEYEARLAAERPARR
jgi:hypothetical protein